MTDKENRSTLFCDISHFTQALFLELGVAYGQHFINNQDLRFQVRSDSKSKSYIHTARVAFHRRVDVRIDFGKCYDLVELHFDFAAAHPEDGPIPEPVFASR